ncbi:MAG: tetratricopeptide repeat protein [Acidobacteria bacterium]|nr:tetratricopeptide repeat protein [Acidobacteriota bacterium]MCA1609480.1 tetratricopeptide repeat protein [Acidobacteriota bacterium]
MTQKISRRALKRNDLADTMGKTVDYVSHHRRGVVEGAVIFGGVVLLAAAFVTYRSYRENEAGRELSAGLAALAAPIAGQPAATGTARTFPTAVERDREADDHLKRAAKSAGTSAGRAAGVILAARDSKSPDAIDRLARAARSGKGEVAAAAELDQARLLAAAGKTTEAIDRLKRAIESSDSAAPKDAMMFTLAEIYEKAGSAADARATYQRLVSDYPNSPYRADARQKL